MSVKTFKYKLDFYYKSLAIYLLTLVIYILIKGNFFHERFEVVFRDPIIYVISLFIVYFVVLLAVNAVSAREIIFDDKTITFCNRFGERKILISEIVGVKFSRTRSRGRDNVSHSKIVKLKLLNRRRPLRIKMNDFGNERQLEFEFRSISKKITTNQ